MLKWLKKKTARVLLCFLPEYSTEIRRVAFPGPETFRVMRRYCGNRMVVAEVKYTGASFVNPYNLNVWKEAIARNAMPDWFQRLLCWRYGHPYPLPSLPAYAELLPPTNPEWTHPRCRVAATMTPLGYWEVWTEPPA